MARSKSRSTKPATAPTAPKGRVAAMAPPKVSPTSSAPAAVNKAPGADTAEAKPPVLRKKEFLERVAKASGLRKNQIKAGMEATLLELGRALDNGETINLKPLGKAQINRVRDNENAKILIVKLRRAKDIEGSETTPKMGGKPGFKSADEKIADAAE